MFAVIRTGGKQYRVAENDVVTIEKLVAEPGDRVVFDEVLMVGAGAASRVGAPLVDGAAVAGEVVDHVRGPKLIWFKKRRRKNSRRKGGHRQDLTAVRITGIGASADLAVAEPAEAAAPVVAAEPVVEAAAPDAVTPTATVVETAAEVAEAPETPVETSDASVGAPVDAATKAAADTPDAVTEPTDTAAPAGETPDDGKPTETRDGA